jgi:hypothetical protein
MPALREAMSKHLRQRLGAVSPQAAKLYARMVEMSRSGRGQARSRNAAYLPELYEACGITVEEMYAYIEELKTARLIEVEGEYPFEDAKIVDATEAAALADEAALRKRSFSDALVELQGNRAIG